MDGGMGEALTHGTIQEDGGVGGGEGTVAPDPKKQATKYRHVKLPAVLMDLIERLVKDGTFGYRSPAEFVVEAVRRRLEDLGLMGRTREK
jgi:hypothetical protein